MKSPERRAPFDLPLLGDPIWTSFPERSEWSKPDAGRTWWALGIRASQSRTPADARRKRQPSIWGASDGGQPERQTCGSQKMVAVSQQRVGTRQNPSEWGQIVSLTPLTWGGSASFGATSFRPSRCHGPA